MESETEEVGLIFGNYNAPFVFLGILSLSYVTFDLLSSLWRGFRNYFLSAPLGLAVDPKKYGDWAVVTGATDGIGEAYAKKLAEKGLNIVLISRSEEKLNKVAKEIETEFKVQTKNIIVDFTDGPEIYETISKGLENIDIGTLVNNVGISNDLDIFHLIDKEGLQNIIKVNCLAATMMTSIVMPGMVNKKKGIIINNASASGMHMPFPFMTVYSSTKAYLDYFSRCLQAEYGSKGIIIQSLLPFFVSTKMPKMKPSLFVPTTEKYVAQAIETIGLEQRTNGYLLHDLEGFLLERIFSTKTGPNFLAPYFEKKIDIRKAYLERKKKKK